MYVQLSDQAGFVPGGTNIGIVRCNEKEVLLIDSGLNDTTARKVLRVVRDELQSNVVAIINTHGHADHFGANAFVHKRTGCEIWAPRIEATIIEHPILQPALLFGGASPADALRSRFLLADVSPVDTLLEHGTQSIHGVELQVVPLPGHSPNQVGLSIEGVFFCADVVFPESAIEKYRIPYLYGLTEHLASLDHAAAIEASIVVPGHGAHAESILDLMTANKAAIERTLSAIEDILSQPMTGDDLAAALFGRLDVPVSDPQSYFLLRPTISAYLAHMNRVGILDLSVDRGSVLWSRS